MRLRELSQSGAALGGDITLSIVTDSTKSDADIIFKKLWHQIYDFERSFSRFLPGSELSIFNRTSGIKTQISPKFSDILQVARIMGFQTNGLYNPFIMPALQRAGYSKSAARGYESDKQIDYSDCRVVGVERLVIGDDWATIPYGTALDLGGCGKGYLADKLGERLDSFGVQGYWLSLSGDIVSKGYDENGDKITINVQNADDPSNVSDYILSCPVKHFGIATSGTFRRQYQESINGWHHIIDPVTQKPAVTDIKLATVCADSGLVADILASCAVILGSKKAPAFLKKHGAKSVILQCVDTKGKRFDKVFGRNIIRSCIANQREVFQNA